MKLKFVFRFIFSYWISFNLVVLALPSVGWSEDCEESLSTSDKIFPPTFTVPQSPRKKALPKDHPYHQEKANFVESRKAMGKGISGERKNSSRKDLDNVDVPYTYKELQGRLIPEYESGPALAEAKILPERLGLPEETDLTAPGLAIKVRDNLDMNSWSPDRFPMQLPEMSVQAYKASSSKSSRAVFLDPLSSGPIEFNGVNLEKFEDRVVSLTRDPHFDYSNATTRSFVTTYANALIPKAFRLAQVSGQPVMTSPLPAITTSGVDGELAPLWSPALLNYYRTWTAANPDIPLMIGRSDTGPYRIVHPMFKALSAYNENTLSKTSMDSLGEALQRIDQAFYNEPGFRFDPALINSNVGRFLGYRFLLGDFGPLGVRFVRFSPEDVGVFVNVKKIKLKLKFDPGSEGFKFVNLIRGHILVDSPMSTISGHMLTLEGQQRYRDWFETVYWLANNNIRASTKSKKNVNETLDSVEIKIKQEAVVTTDSWTSASDLSSFFTKYGHQQMGFLTKEDYLSSAVDFFSQKYGSQVLVIGRSSQAQIKYDFESHEFGVVNSKGKIVTYLRLEDGQSLAKALQEYLEQEI